MCLELFDELPTFVHKTKRNKFLLVHFLNLQIIFQTNSGLGIKIFCFLKPILFTVSLNKDLWHPNCIESHTNNFFKYFFCMFVFGVYPQTCRKVVKVAWATHSTSFRCCYCYQLAADALPYPRSWWKVSHYLSLSLLLLLGPET